MIRIDGIHKSFNGFPVLKGISFSLEKGEILALIGGSGNGKSVILKHVVGLIRPDRGHVLIEDKDMCRLKGKELEELRRRFGFLFQSGALFSSLTVFDNVAFPLREKKKLGEKEVRQRVLHELDQVGLAGSENKFPAELSGGMVKRTAFARALITKPEIMLFDEPTTGLDPVIAHTIIDLIRSAHQQRQFTAIIVSHELSRVFKIAHKVAMLHEGTILTIGTPQDILSSSDPIVRQFTSGSLEGPIKLH